MKRAAARTLLLLRPSPHISPLYSRSQLAPFHRSAAVRAAAPRILPAAGPSVAAASASSSRREVLFTSLTSRVLNGKPIASASTAAGGAVMNPLSSTGGSGGCIILYDGVCLVCNASVRFVLDRDRKGRMHFVTTQSELGQWILSTMRIPTDLDSMILIEGVGVEGSSLASAAWFSRSTAALRIGGSLSPRMLFAPLCWSLELIPAAWRDRGYDLFAASRYRLFGRLEDGAETTATCRRLNKADRARFLEYALKDMEAEQAAQENLAAAAASTNREL